MSDPDGNKKKLEYVAEHRRIGNNIDKRESGRLGHDQLQALEHSNQMIAEHLALMKDLSAQVDTMVDTFIPVMRIYVNNIQEIRVTMFNEVREILRSSQELRGISKGTKDLMDFVEVVHKLVTVLTPENVAKIRAVIKSGDLA